VKQAIVQLRAQSANLDHLDLPDHLDLAKDHALLFLSHRNSLARTTDATNPFTPLPSILMLRFLLYLRYLLVTQSLILLFLALLRLVAAKSQIIIF
jgi:hypothetical protein